MGIRDQPPDLFSAAIPVAAPPTSEAAEALAGVPVYAIHSRDDGLFDWQIIEEVVQRLRARGVDAELRLVEGATHFQTKRFVGPQRLRRGRVGRGELPAEGLGVDG